MSRNPVRPDSNRPATKPKRPTGYAGQHQTKPPKWSGGKAPKPQGSLAAGHAAGTFKPSRPKPSGGSYSGGGGSIGTAVGMAGDMLHNSKPTAMANRPVSGGGTKGQGASKAPGKAPSRGSAPSRGQSGGSSNRFAPSSGGSRGGGSGTPSRVVNRFGTQPTRAPGSNGFSGGSSRGGTRGSVRASSASRGSTGAANKPSGPDPLDKLVDEIIASRIAPIQDERRQLREQSAGDINQLGRLSEGFQQNLTGLRADTSADMGAAMARAMELRGYSADTLAKGQEWAKSLMAPTNGGTGSLQTAESSAETIGASNAAFDAMGRELSSRGEGMGEWLQKQSAIGTAQTNEQVQQQMLARQAAERAMNSKIAQEKGQKSEMLYGMRQAEADQALKAQVAQAEWGIEAQKQASLDNYRQGQLALGAQRNAISAARLTETANAKPKGTPGRYGNIDKKYDTAIKSVWDSLHKRASDGSLATPWRTAFDEITDQGLPANTAALLVTQWFPDSITKSDPRNIREMLANRGVSAAAQANIIKRFFGPKGWAQANRRGGLAGAIDYGQQAANSVTR